jgi:hypothetical protein
MFLIVHLFIYFGYFKSAISSLILLDIYWQNYYGSGS